MGSSFILDLDTEGPIITIAVPSYTIPEIDTMMLIESNEPLSGWHEIYVIDSMGARVDLIFSLVGDRTLLGIYNFANTSIGIATLYATVTDDVHNLSDQVSTTINIRKGADVSISTSNYSMDVIADQMSRDVYTASNCRGINILTASMELLTYSKTREIEVSIHE